MLIDPRNDQIRYVGKCNINRLTSRFYRHIFDAKNKKSKPSHKNSWIINLLNDGFKPVMEPIDEVPADEWVFWEMHYISLYRSWGFDLTNGTDGGEGVTMTPEIRNKISKKNKGRIISEESRNKIRKSLLENIPWNKGKSGILSIETRKKISDALKGKIQSQESKDKRSKKLKGRKRAQWEIEKVIAAKIKNGTFHFKMSEEQKEKLRKANFSRRHKPIDVNSSESNEPIISKEDRMKLKIERMRASIEKRNNDPEYSSEENRRKRSERAKRGARTRIDNETKRGEKRRGFKHSDESKMKMSEQRKGKKQSAETIAKRVQKNTGKKRTPEQCARIGNKKGYRFSQAAIGNMKKGWIRRKENLAKQIEQERLIMIF